MPFSSSLVLEDVVVGGDHQDGQKKKKDDNSLFVHDRFVTKTKYPFDDSVSLGKMTREESRSAWKRMINDASNHLAVGPVHALVGGTITVWALGLYEGLAVWKKTGKGPLDHHPFLRYRFAMRYATAQTIPSFVRLYQPSTAVMETMMKGPQFNHLVYAASELPANKSLLLTRLLALRATIGGSIVLSQIMALTSVLTRAKESYAQRIRQGKEPPLRDGHGGGGGVVVRLAGCVSDTTNLTMQRQSRKHIFPIFEEPTLREVQDLVQLHGPAATNQRKKKHNHDDEESWSWLGFAWTLLTGRRSSYAASRSMEEPRVPIYWQVDDGRYSLASSWKGMRVPESWLFDVAHSDEKLLILEADATPDASAVWSFPSTLDEDALDLDLHEAAQGFAKLASISSGKEHRVLRVLLVDANTMLESGSKHQSTIRQNVEELDLADIVVDCRAPLILSLTKWLKNQDNNREAITTKDGLRLVVLETPWREWFVSMQTELKKHGYMVMGYRDALQMMNNHPNKKKEASDNKSLDSSVPFLVYQATTADTIHTAQQYVSSGKVTTPQQVCALCNQHAPLNELVLTQGVTYLSSSDLHDRLLRWVRERATVAISTGKEDLHDPRSIQHDLDHHLPDILHVLFPEHNNERKTGHDE